MRVRIDLLYGMKFDLYLSISKFVGNIGFSLTQNSSDVVLSFQDDEERNVKLEQIMN